MKKTIYFAGGDLRQITAAEELSRSGFGVETVGLSEEEPELSGLANADVLILPLPASYDGVYINAPLAGRKISASELLDRVRPDCFVLGACISPVLAAELERRGLHFADYYDREELIIKNAIPTAEGAVELALSEMPITLFESRALVIGYGRVGEVLAGRLAAMGARVTVSARRCSDFAWIAEKGMRHIHTDSIITEADSYDLIVNTVPAVVLTEEVLRRVRQDALIIDLASKPGGVDFKTAGELGKNVIWALSLPGKTAPITSGKIIAEAILNILTETGV